jgi:hypothetical protein
VGFIVSLEQSYALLLSVGVGSMLVPIVLVLMRIYNSRVR